MSKITTKKETLYKVIYLSFLFVFFDRFYFYFLLVVWGFGEVLKQMGSKLDSQQQI